MKINAITPNLYKEQQNNKIASFNGLLHKYPRILSKSAMASMMQVSEDDINHLTRFASNKKQYFLELLVNRYNIINFYRPKKEQDSVESVFNIYKNISRVKNSHLNLVDYLPFSITILENIFNLTKNKSSYFEFVQKVNKDLEGQRNLSFKETAISREEEAEQRGNIIIDLLKSKNIKEYVKNYSKYRPFVKTNANNPKLVSLLDESFESGVYDYELEREKRFLEKLKRGYTYPETENFNFKVYQENYSRNADELMSTLLFFLESDNDYFIKHDKAFKEMYVSTNKNNYKLRYKLIKFYISSIKGAKDDSLEKFNELNARIDTDKNVEKFVKRLLKDKVNISMDALLKILDSNPPKMLNIFYPNIKKICTELSNENKVSCINKELKKPFYTTKHYKREKENIFEMGYSTNRVSNYIGTTIGNIRWSLTKVFDILASNPFKSTETLVAPPEPIKVTEPIKVSAIKQVESSPVFAMPNVLETPAPIAESVIQQPSHTAFVPSKTLNKESTVESDVKPKVQEVKRRRINRFEIKLKKPTAKQIETSNNTLDYVKTKLGPKVFMDQSHDYGVVATKMRLQMLPEIFDSIAETRKRDRSVGVPKPKVSNKDALLLFSKINGSNRKLVNYLLKKRNTDGTRIFDIKDIVLILDNAEKEIRLAKKANPNYRAKDRKDYYSAVLREKVQEYGKVKHLRKKKIDIKNA